MNTHPDVQQRPAQPQFRAGRMDSYITTRPFTLGNTGVTVPSGAEILFDGTKAHVDGAEYTLPFLRGAVKAGWMVLADAYNPDDPRYSQKTRAHIQVRPPKGGNPLDPQPRMAIVTTESDEREVGNVRQHAASTERGNRGYVRGQTPVNVTIRGVEAGQLVRTQRGMMEVEVQDGVTLDRELQTPAGERSKERLDLTSEKAAQALRVAQNAQVKPGQGISEDEMLDRMSEEDRAEYLARKDALRSQYVTDPAPTAALPRPASRQVVFRVASTKNGQHEGMSFTNTVGGGVQIGDASDGEVVGRVHGNDEVETFEQEGIKFTTTNASARKRPVVNSQTHVASSEPAAPVPAHLDVRRSIAKAVCPDFPANYDFALSPKKKLARLQADYEDRTDVLRAVFAAESDDMKALLIQEFPQAFAA